MKKKTVKVIQEKKKYKKFDLVSGKESARIMSAFLTLQSTEGWALFVQVYEANIKLLDQQIIDKKDLKNTLLTDIECDALRVRREIYKEMIEYPNKMVQENMQVDMNEPNDDPYFNKEEMAERRGVLERTH